MPRSSGTRRGAGVDPAVLQARRVVGLYGDPDVSWSVVVAFRMGRPLSLGDVAERAAALVGEQAHLGRVPEVIGFTAGGEQDVLEAFANDPYGDRDPLVRVGVSEDCRDLLVAAHHGAIDGLGLLGAASVLVGEPLASSARGVPRDAEPAGFVRRGVRRLAEALFFPPARVSGDRPGPSESGDWLAARQVEVVRPGSAALVRAAVDLARRAGVGPDRSGRLVVSMGLSRRPGTPVPTPDRDTAYMRLAAAEVRSTAEARVLLARTEPEPAFPVTDGQGLAPRVTRLLAHRLGATVLVSNLGLVDNPAVETIRFWPVPTGPSGVALGLASTRTATTLTLRARRGWFSAPAAADLAELAGDCLVRATEEHDAAGRGGQ